jgi:hypothetical protein
LADIIQTPGPTNTGGGGGSAAGWAVAVIILLAVVAWFVFGSGMLNRNTTYRADVKITPPASQSPQSNPPTGGSASGSVATPPTPPNPRP